MNENTRESPKKLRKKKWKQREALVQVYMVHPDPKKSQIFIFPVVVGKRVIFQVVHRTKGGQKTKRTIAKALIKVTKKYEV